MLIEASGLDPAKFPEIRASADVVGRVSRKAGADTGLLAGTPVVAGVGDGPSATLGAGITQEKTGYIYLGSSGWVSMVTREPVFDPRFRVFNVCHADPHVVLPFGTMQSAGAAYKWLAERVFYGPSTHGARTKSSYEALDREAEDAPKASRNLLFLPYLMGERSPYYDTAARGVFLGLTMIHGRGEMIRAVLEGVAFNLRVILEAFQEQGIDPPELRIIGGGAKSRLWRQILADILGRMIVYPALLDEATSLGAAIVGGVAVGIFEGFDVAGELVLEKERQHPDHDQAVRGKYDALYSVFKDAYLANRAIFERLASLDAV